MTDQPQRPAQVQLQASHRPEEMATRAKLFAKVAGVYKDLKEHEETMCGRNEDQGYEYVPDNQLMPILRDLLSKHGIVAMPPRIIKAEDLPPVETRRTKLYRTRIYIQMGIVDTETGYYETGIVAGEGVDFMGPHGMSGAITNAKKSFYGVLFMMALSATEQKQVDDARALAQNGDTGVILESLRYKAGAGMKAVGGKEKLLAVMPKDLHEALGKPPHQWEYDLCTKVIETVMRIKKDPGDRDQSKESAEQAADALEKAAGKSGGGKKK